MEVKREWDEGRISTTAEPLAIIAALAGMGTGDASIRRHWPDPRDERMATPDAKNRLAVGVLEKPWPSSPLRLSSCSYAAIIATVARSPLSHRHTADPTRRDGPSVG